MRPALTLLLLAATLGGCATVRQGLGAFQRAADKGINIGGPPDAPSPASAQDRTGLPAGLGGDKAHAAYTSPPQR